MGKIIANKMEKEKRFIRVCQMTELKNEPNENYKPNPIDISTVFKVKNKNEKTANIYWSSPTGSYGDISYKIVNDDDAKEESVQVLPYSVSLQKNASINSFKVITVTKVDHKLFE